MKTLLLSLLLLSGCATADYAQLADSATTAIAMESGFVEGNPLFGGASWPIIAGVKLGVTQGAKLLPYEYCQPTLVGLTVSGMGAALWNVGVLLGSGVAGLPVALVATVYFWDDMVADSVADCSEKARPSIIVLTETSGWGDE